MNKKLIKIIIALILFTISIVIVFDNLWINNILYILSYIIIGADIVLKAIKNIFRGNVFDENFLMTIATIGAFAIGESAEAVAVMLFYQVGELFQNYAVDKSRKSITELMDIRPDIANVEKNGEIVSIDPELVNIEDIIIVKPGDKVPLDGIIIEGKSSIDTSALTGESLFRDVEEGEEVLSGCINQSGLLKIKVTKDFGESTVSKILELVENASNKKAKSENFITKFARYYTPIVVLIAVILAIVPPLIMQNEIFMDWLYRALTFLVVSCPCALVISIPLGFFGGIGGASRRGILVKGSNYLESLAESKIVVMDKTGTLTKGVFEVQKIESIGIEKDELIELVAHAESYSTHPISLSIKKAYVKDINSSIITNIEELPGFGVIAKINEKTVLVGNDKLMKKNDIEYIESEDIGTVLYVAINNIYSGYIVISDEIKEDSNIAIKELRKNNIKQIVMLTGDRKNIGEKIAKELDIDEVYTELLPAGKVEKVEELMKTKRSKEKLIFVGDGINDAPVLSISDIGIAMGGLGSDAAIEAADIVIMTDEVSKIVDAIEISKKTLRIVKQNIYLALGIKIGVLILSVFGLSTMWEAVFADVGVSIIAILNSLRMLRRKNKCK